LCGSRKATATPTPARFTQVRDGDKRIVRLKEGVARGRHVVIVDDLVQSGGTLIECRNLLGELGAKHGAWGRRGLRV
jgi:adenine/guanine phosphoribosyltransferase-like PRPP-binding protein